MAELKIYGPDGVVGKSATARAASRSVLSGTRIVALDNGKPGAARILSALAHNISERTGATFAGVVAKGSAATPCEPEVFDTLRRRGDIVLTGTAD